MSQAVDDCEAQWQMDTPIQPWRYNREPLSATLSAIQEAADEIEEFSISVLRQRIDEVHALIRQNLPADWTDMMTEDHGELNRLLAKVDALRERMRYSYFGPAQVRSLREALYDLHEIIARLEIRLAREARSTSGSAEVH